MKRIVDGNTETGKNYPIQPHHINLKEHFFEAFGHSETESSAWHVVRVCQGKGGWLPFTKEDLDQSSRENFWFNRLVRGAASDPDNYVIQGDDGLFRVTHEFIARCFLSSPAN